MKPTLGVTGPIGAGKTAATKILSSYGYRIVSLTEELKKEVSRRGLPQTRQILLDTGDELRKEHGNNVLASWAAKTIDEIRSEDPEQKIIIEGIKNPGEITFLKQKYDMYLIGIEANDEIRYDRVLKRASYLDSETGTETLRKIFKRDMGEDQEKYGQHIDECLKLCDVRITNDKSQKELEEKIVKALSEQ